jgi:hypothetical protein
MENAHPEQIAVLPDHLQNDLGILGIADAHGVVDASFNCLQKKIGALAGGIDKLGLFSLQVQIGIDAYAESQEAYGYEYYPGCQVFEYQPASLALT